MSAQLEYQHEIDLSTSEIAIVNEGLESEYLIFPDGTVLDFSDD